MQRKRTTDVMFDLRVLMQKYREGQKQFCRVFVDLEETDDNVPREELWYCMGRSGVAEKYVRVVRDKCEDRETMVSCTAGVTDGFKLGTTKINSEPLLVSSGDGQVEFKYLGSATQSNRQVKKRVQAGCSGWR